MVVLPARSMKLGTLAVSAILLTAGSGSPAHALELHGHRGARGLLPENTLPAFKAALKLGVDCLELDVGLTRDRQPVIAHDRLLNPNITRKRGKWISEPVLFKDLNAADIRAFDVGRIKPGTRYAERFSKQRGMDNVAMPLLRDLLALPELVQASNVCLNIEIKRSPKAPEQTHKPGVMADALLQVVTDLGFRPRLRVQSFDWAVLVHIRKVAPDVPLIFLTAERSWLDNVERGRPGRSPWLGGIDIDDAGGSLPAAIKKLGGHTWSPYHRDLTRELLQAAHRLGLKVVVWTVNKVSDMETYKAMGVDGIITDYPDRAVPVIRGR